MLIYGTGKIAELASFYFKNDLKIETTAFVEHRQFIKSKEFNGKPIAAFEDIFDLYPPSEHKAFIALSYVRVNRLREECFKLMKSGGYTLESYVSPHLSRRENIVCGENCFILEDNTIQPFARIGHNVTLWSGNHIGHHSQIGDHTFIASHAVISGNVSIGQRCFIGVNATVRDGVTIGDDCVVGASTLILADAPDKAVFAAEATPISRVPSSRLRSI